MVCEKEASARYSSSFSTAFLILLLPLFPTFVRRPVSVLFDEFLSRFKAGSTCAMLEMASMYNLCPRRLPLYCSRLLHLLAAQQCTRFAAGILSSTPFLLPITVQFTGCSCFSTRDISFSVHSSSV